MMTSDDSTVSVKGTVLERKIGLLGAVSLVMGTIIGSGIFISPKYLVDAAGSEALSLLMWAIGGLISLFGALSLAELSSIIPTSAGDYNYLRTTYARWVGFIYGWNFGLLIFPSGLAVMALTSAEYMLVPVYSDGCGQPPEMHRKMLAACVLLLLVTISCYSVRLSSGINVVFMCGKVAALAVIIVAGIVRLAQGKYQYIATGLDGSSKTPGKIIMGFYSAMWAYDGWASLTGITEEIINPRRNIPLAFYIAIPFITILYLLTNISYFTVMSTEQLVASPAVAITWAEEVIPEVYWLMPAFVAMSTFGSINSSLFAPSRLFYVMSREGEMPQILTYVHHKRETPMPAVIFICFFAIIYILAGEVVTLIDFLSFTTWISHAMVQMCVIVLRFKMKDAVRTYKVPIVFPVVVFIFSVALVVVPMVDSPQIEFLYASILMLAGLVFYIPIVFCGNRAGCMRYITQFCQLLMQVCPGITDSVEKKSH